MKALKSCCLGLLIATGAATGVNAEEFRTDINPAFRYYQAFIVSPDLSQADRDYLFTNDWRGQKLPERFNELVARYNGQFGLVRQAAHATVPCDWGIDMSPGPRTLLPHLARNKAVAQTARLRVLWHLQNGRQAEAREDLLAALALGRNASRDGTLISVLVQIAVENIACATVAENFHQFSPESLKQLGEGFDGAPSRGTMAACMATEKLFFHDWMVAKVLELQKANAGNDARVMAQIRELFAGMESSESGQTNMFDPIAKAAGGTSDGVLKLVREEEPLYARLAAIMALPESAYEDQAKQFSAEIRASRNPLVDLTFPAIGKARSKEFAIEVELAMVRAAIEYKLRGDQGFQSVTDPCGQGPFDFQRFVFEGADRGFVLKSAYAGRGFPEMLIFVEKDGPPFYVNGKNTGKPVSP